MREPEYQARLIKKLHKRFPGAIIMKNDSGYIQGIPDLTIFFYNQWAMLEVKISEDAPERPNQRYHVENANDMSFAAFIFPENEEAVLNELQLAFSLGR